MRIVNYAAVDPVEWDAVAEASPWAWSYHLSAWIALELRYWLPESRAFMIRSDAGEPIAILPLYVSEQSLSHGVERVLHSGLHRHTGLAVVPNMTRKDLKHAQKFAIKEVFRIAGEVKADRIQLNAQNLAPGNLPPSRQEIPFFVEDFHFFFGLALSAAGGGVDPAPGAMNSFSDQIVLLDQTEEHLFAGLEKSAQWGVHRGIREGIEVTEASTDGEFREFVDLRLDAHSRTGETVMPDEYHADVLGVGRSRVLLAKLRGKVIGGVQLLVYKGASAYFAGFGLNEYLDLQYNDLLQWNAILWSKHHGLRFYRLGPHFPDMPADTAVFKKGRFKKKFGGQPFHILQGSYFLSPGKYLRGPAGSGSTGDERPPSPASISARPQLGSSRVRTALRLCYRCLPKRIRSLAMAILGRRNQDLG